METQHFDAKEAFDEGIIQLYGKQADLIRSQDLIKNELFTKYNVKRGLRDVNGDGVLAGLTHISCIKSKEIIDGKAVPCRGKLTYRGYDIHDLVRGIIADERPGFEKPGISAAVRRTAG